MSYQHGVDPKDQMPDRAKLMRECPAQMPPPSRSLLARSWPADMATANGSYFCRCTLCKQDFIGHKSRVVCRECFHTVDVEKAPDTKYLPCMSVMVDEEANTVELLTEQGVQTYAEWIAGEGADICLHRDMETKKVVGVTLECRGNRLVVHHEGPMRINTGFKAEEHDGLA